MIENRRSICCIVAFAVWLTGWLMMPFPGNNPVLGLIFCLKREVYYPIKWTYIAVWFTTPYIATSILLSLAYIFFMKIGPESATKRLPPYPDPANRSQLSLVVGEVHKTKKPWPAKNPRWLAIPERGLYTGVAGKSYNFVRDVVFEPKVFAELKNAQSIVLAYDGLNPLAPTRCYLKPYYLDPNRSYFEQLARGEL